MKLVCKSIQITFSFHAQVEFVLFQRKIIDNLTLKPITPSSSSDESKSSMEPILSSKPSSPSSSSSFSRLTWGTQFRLTSQAQRISELVTPPNTNTINRGPAFDSTTPASFLCQWQRALKLSFSIPNLNFNSGLSNGAPPIRCGVHHSVWFYLKSSVVLEE